jgi:MazG family protein
MTSNLDQFIATIARLRAEDGCPWDREQTHRSLARYLLEEAYEVMEAIHEGDADNLKEELGDLLLQIVLNAQVAKDAGQFTMEDVAESINSKMISRHPHVFGEKSLNTARQVLMQWDDLKDKEKALKKTQKKSALDGIQRTLPALLQALKISEKAVSQGFEWRNESEVWEKLDSEIRELKEAISNPELTQPATAASARFDVELELGDVLFTLVNVARWHALNPEESLIHAMDKFRQRFEVMEELKSKPLKEYSKDEYETLWNQAKDALKAKV